MSIDSRQHSERRRISFAVIVTRRAAVACGSWCNDSHEVFGSLDRREELSSEYNPIALRVG
eukprot:scaffold6096_cov39-Cyclotella_meneghiniana.AAC.2